MSNIEVIFQIVSGASTFVQAINTINKQFSGNTLEKETVIDLNTILDEVSQLQNSTLIDVFTIMSSNNMQETQKLRDVYRHISVFCSLTNQHKYSYRVVQDTEMNNLTSLILYRKMYLISAYLRTIKENPEPMINAYRELANNIIDNKKYESIEYQRVNSFDLKYFRKLICELGLQIQERKMKVIGELPENRKYCNLDITTAGDSAGILVWSVNDRICFISSTTSEMKYMKRVGRITKSVYEKNSHNQKYAEINEIINNNRDCIKCYFVETEQNKLIKYYLDYYLIK